MNDPKVLNAGDANDRGPTLRPPTFEEIVAIEAYREVVKQQLTSINTASSSVLTASLSLATAYTALLVFAAPKGHLEVGWVVSPYGFFAAAALACVLALVKGVKSDAGSDMGKIEESVKPVAKAKKGPLVGSLCCACRRSHCGGIHHCQWLRSSRRRE